MKTLYLDIFSGISGDMFIGAMLDLGVPFDGLQQELAKLNLDDYHAHATRQHKSSIEGVKFDVHTHDHGHEHHDHPEEHSHGHSHSEHHEKEHEHEHDGHHHDHDTEPSGGHTHKGEHHHHEHGRTYRQIRDLIRDSELSDWVKEKAVAVFERIARAEGKIHGMPADEVHFHEVGAVDSIIDIVGACVALEMLGKPRVLAGPVTEGHGFIRCAHGNFPIPAPATIAILAERGIPINQCDEPHELVTPTGAALLAEFAEEFGGMRGIVPEKIGYGLGTRDNQTRPNVLRAILASTGQETSKNDWLSDSVAVLETNLDDISSELLGYVVERALAEGALDVFHTSIQMKKNRPGVLLTVICQLNEQDRFSELLLRETTALGVRRTIADRRKLKRRIVIVQTEFGALEIKIGSLNGKVIQASPEYEWCKLAAEKHKVPLKEVYDAAVRALKDL